MWHAYEDVFSDCHCGLLFFYFCMFPHCDSSSHSLCNICQSSLYCVFVSVVYLVLCGIENALLTFAVIMPSSHNIFVSLCCCSVDHFIPMVTILRYDCKHALNTIIKTLSVVGTYKPSTLAKGLNDNGYFLTNQFD
jgi:hypothetical protein